MRATTAADWVKQPWPSTLLNIRLNKAKLIRVDNVSIDSGPFLLFITSLRV